jgi:hypothetical protein
MTIFEKYVIVFALDEAPPAEELLRREETDVHHPILSEYVLMEREPGSETRRNDRRRWPHPGIRKQTRSIQTLTIFA